jgi:hypothetical protein
MRRLKRSLINVSRAQQLFSTESTSVVIVYLFAEVDYLDFRLHKKRNIGIDADSLYVRTNFSSSVFNCDASNRSEHRAADGVEPAKRSKTSQFGFKPTNTLKRGKPSVTAKYELTSALQSFTPSKPRQNDVDLDSDSDGSGTTNHPQTAFQVGKVAKRTNEPTQSKANSKTFALDLLSRPGVKRKSSVIRLSCCFILTQGSFQRAFVHAAMSNFGKCTRA